MFCFNFDFTARATFARHYGKQRNRRRRFHGCVFLQEQCVSPETTTLLLMFLVPKDDYSACWKVLMVKHVKYGPAAFE